MKSLRMSRQKYRKHIEKLEKARKRKATLRRKGFMSVGDALLKLGIEDIKEFDEWVERIWRMCENGEITCTTAEIISEDGKGENVTFLVKFKDVKELVEDFRQ